MFKSTLFIAVQCCQCSTMQVKQQKKSNNKWSCVVCNQKQSVRKIYAQGYQAKDIRQFVQSFNMSRKVADEQAALQYESSSLGHFVEHLESNQVEEEYKPKRRTDWSQYLEDEEDQDPAYLKSLPNEGEMFEPEIATEIPEGVMFKKAKSKGNCGSSSSSSGLGSIQKYKPNFFKKDANKKTYKPHDEFARTEANHSDSARNVKRRWQQEEDLQNKKMAAAKSGASKWSEYMVEDENDSTFHGEGERETFAEDFKIMCGYNDQETEVTAETERVEEDIHPDFL